MNVCKTKTPNVPVKKPDGSYVISNSGKSKLFKQNLTDIFQLYSEIFSPLTMNTVEEFLKPPLPVSFVVKHFSRNEGNILLTNIPLISLPSTSSLLKLQDGCLRKQSFTIGSHLFKSVFRLSYFSIIWKCSIILYSFLSLTNHQTPFHAYKSAKIPERLIFKLILPSLIRNTNLPDSQFGFRNSHSTVHQVINRRHHYFRPWKKSSCTYAFLDILQTFDRVWHDGLLFKIKKF